VARRHRWRQGLLHGAVDILGIAAAALLLTLTGVTPSVETPWDPRSWTLATGTGVLFAAAGYLLMTRLLLWLVHTPNPGTLPTVTRTAVIRQSLVGVALLGIAPLICVVAVALPVLLPLFSIPL
ncbi:hypothetical protein ADL27_45770, partial [Streptomyces sp. NRRL F-6602]